MSVPSSLHELAAAHGVATWYLGGDRERVDVDPDVVVRVLAELGVDASSAAAVEDALEQVRARQESRSLPPTLVVHEGDEHDLGVDAVLELEDGGTLDVRGTLPADVPLGYHRLRAGDETSHLLVVPARLPEVPLTWGWMLQLYSMHSRESWGMGDFADLAAFARRAATEQGAGVLLVNPVQAVAPAHPVERSPYSPASRRFANPLYLRVTETAAYAAADAATRQQVLSLAPDAEPELVDYDAVWDAKLEALERLWRFAERVEPDESLRDFATYCALAEELGADWHGWPEALRDPAGEAVAAERESRADRVAFHVWLQHECRAQLDRARAEAHDAGMSVGLVHDLPVGVSPAGADTWAQPHLFAQDVRVGCPPDAFNELGQDWGLPPWRPDRLAETGYAPFREVVRSVLRHGDGIRVDHVAGMWRLWWIPEGEPPLRGTYVHYDSEAMLGVLLLEATRAGAVVVGEDLGTVEDVVTETMQERGILSSAVLWFERDWEAGGQPHRRPADWKPETMASITTHDLPTAPGWLEAEHVRLRASLDLLDGPAEEAYAGAAADKEALLDLVRAEGLDEDDLVLALHTLIARAASRLVLSAPADAVGEMRQPNLPGTVDEYPNWRVPLKVSLEEFFDDPRVDALTAPLREARPLRR